MKVPGKGKKTHLISASETRNQLFYGQDSGSVSCRHLSSGFYGVTGFPHGLPTTLGLMEKYPHYFPISPRPFLIVSPAWLKINENKTCFSQRPHIGCAVVVVLSRGSSGGQGLEPWPSCCLEGFISSEERPPVAASSSSRLPLLSWG